MKLLLSALLLLSLTNLSYAETLQEKNKKLVIQISDNGSGIPEKDLSFIFDKFYRVAREDSKEIEGFGIGLSYVKKICNMHHWKIEIKNNKDQGITAEITIQDYE
jgi:two-component system phosphate regulon sensor histidine kinase PhoR